jgi:proteasome alpha subunit
VSANGDRQAYDRGVSVFSPDGRLYQVEYAREAVRNGNAVVGVRGADAVVLAADSRGRSPLLAAESVEKLHAIDGRVGAATAGHVADGRRIVDFARQRAQAERLRYGDPISPKVLATEIADHVQEATQAGGTRPFGSGLLVGGVTDGQSPHLFEVDPSGAPSEWQATALGGGAEEATAVLQDQYDASADREADRDLALEALAASIDGDDDGLAENDVDVAVLENEDGYRRLDETARGQALESASVQAS